MISTTEPFDLLFVCTGNICRSPTAELMAAHRLPPHRFRVHSAGTYGLEGYPIEPMAAALLAEEEIAHEQFRARRLVAAYVEDADLVLGATREHRAAAVTLVPRAAARTFTLREFARLAAAVDPAALPGETDPAERARALVAAAAAQRGRAWAKPEDDDVADPYGRDEEAYRHAAADIAAALAWVATVNA